MQNPPESAKNAPALGRMIYEAPDQMVKMIKMIKRLSISTTLLSAGVQPILIPKLLASGSTITMGFAGITCAGIILSPLVLNWFTRRYVTELYYNDNEQKFTLKRLNFINRPVQLTYKAQDVNVPDVLGVFTTYTAKKQPFFIDPNLLLDYEPYKKMLGYDKPVDLRREELINEIRKLKDMKKEEEQK